MKTDEEILQQILEIEQLTRKLRIDLEERSSKQQTGKLQIGDKVNILNPKKGQETTGTVSKIGAFRVTIETKKGKVIRAYKNLQRE
jgi:hypothetical protein